MDEGFGVPLTDDGRAMRHVERGWADPACVRCDGCGYTGHGSAREACECFLFDSDVLAARDACQAREDAV